MYDKMSKNKYHRTSVTSILSKKILYSIESYSGKKFFFFPKNIPEFRSLFNSLALIIKQNAQAKVVILFDFYQTIFLTFTTLWADSADDKLMIFFFFFPSKTTDISCKLSLE